MKLRNRLIIVVITTILFIGIAILIWANQTHKITIWGDWAGEPYPEVTQGKAVAIDGTLKKDGDYYFITQNNLYPYDIYIINSLDVKNSLEPLVNKKISAYGSLGGMADNELLILWANGKTIITEDQARTNLNEEINQDVITALVTMTEAQRNCITKIITWEEFQLFLENEALTNLSNEQKNTITKCINEAK